MPKYILNCKNIRHCFSKTQCVPNVSICMEYESAAVVHLMAMHYTRKCIDLHFTYDRLTEKTHSPFIFLLKYTFSQGYYIY